VKNALRLLWATTFFANGNPAHNRPAYLIGNSISTGEPANDQQKEFTAMNFKRATATLGAALILAGAPAFASATIVQTDPISIEGVQLYGGAFEDSSEDSTGFSPGSAAISFTNQYGSPATEVVFVLETNGFVIDRFDDIGNFAPGATVKHAFAENQRGGDMRVAVEKAVFADGTVWQNPDVAQAPNETPAVGVAPSRF
jgi:hypothetical protein